MQEGKEAEYLEHLLEEYDRNPGFKFDAMEGQVLAAEVVRLRRAADAKAHQHVAKKKPAAKAVKK